MIALKSVTKTYPLGNSRRYVLRDVSFELPMGRNIGILGRNGAGKSTLLRIIGGTTKPDTGSVIRTVSCSWPLGLVGGFQGSLTGRQNAEFVCRIHGLDRSQTVKILNYVEEFSELGDYMDMPAKTYSNGMTSRLKFAISLAFDFDVYLVDELTSVGDESFRRKSQLAFEQMRKRATLVFVSHSLQMVKNICDSGIVVHDGQLIYCEDVKEAIRTYEALIAQPAKEAAPAGGQHRD